ncbi:hypothetical protein [Nonomuraea sp. NPDC046570]|uniref:hypothetical protein n=1 Tax=Nonomuraea sp. NPDC046570 TaxID=3155255 RepID=UPI0034115F15
MGGTNSSRVVAGGILYGLAPAWLIGRIRPLVRDPGGQIVLSLATPFVAYLGLSPCWSCSSGCCGRSWCSRWPGSGRSRPAALRQELTGAQRHKLDQLYRKGRIGAGTKRKLGHELDLEERGRASGAQ